MMEKQHVEVFALPLVYVKILARKLEGEIIELHRISRSEELWQLLAEGDLLSTPRQGIFRVISVSTSHGQLVGYVALLLFFHHLL